MKKILAIAAIALLGLAGTALYFKVNSTDPLTKVEAAKLVKLEDAVKKPEKTERDTAVDQTLVELQPDYDSSTDKPAFLKALNTRVEKSPTRLKDDSGKLARDNDFVAPTPSSASGPLGTPTTKKNPGDTTPDDLLSYLKVISRTKPEFKLNAITQPYSFALPLEIYHDSSKQAILAGADIELKKDGLVITDVVPVQIHLVLTADSARFECAHLFFTGKKDGAAFPSEAGKVGKIPVPLDPSEYTPEKSKALAKVLLDKLVSRTGIPATSTGYGVKLDVRRCEIVSAP